MANGVADFLELPVFDLVFFHHGDVGKSQTDMALSRLAGRARDVTPVDRRIPESRQTRQLLKTLGGSRRTVYAAQISACFVMSIFPFRRRLRLRTFDEGAFNIKTDGPFFADRKIAVRSMGDMWLRLKFPSGIVAFSKERSERHFTAFDPALNLMSDISVRVPLEWGRYLEESEAGMSRDTRSVMVLPCFQDFSGPTAARRRILDRARDCDLVVRHPRDEDLADIDSVVLASPVEALIDKARENGPVVVHHHASTVGLTLADWENVTLNDLSQD